MQVLSGPSINRFVNMNINVFASRQLLIYYFFLGHTIPLKAGVTANGYVQYLQRTSTLKIRAVEHTSTLM